MILLPRRKPLHRGVRVPGHARVTRELRSLRKQRGFIINPYVFGGGPPPFACDAADFDGNDWLSRASNLTGIAASGRGILSFWIRFDTFHATDQQFILMADDTGSGFSSYFYINNPSHASEAVLSEASGDQVVHNGTGRSTGVWYHFLYAWDTDPFTRFQLYINDVANGTVDVNDSTNVAWNTIDRWSIGAWASDGSLRIDGGLAEFYFHTGSTLDMSVEANRRLFRSAGGKPISLGSDGSTPMGSAPRIYLHLDDGESAANFAINRGSGGNFTVNGALTTYASSPTD
jgi:hypothetical protein